MKLYIERNEDRTVKRGLVELEDVAEIALLHNILEQWVKENIATEWKSDEMKASYKRAAAMFDAMNPNNAIPMQKHKKRFINTYVKKHRPASKETRP